MIEIKYLKTLTILKKNGSIAATAVQLHKTQSALSHQFKNIESKLGFKIFIRNSKPIKFTIQGKRLLKLAKKILPIINKTIKKCVNNISKKIKIAIEYHSCIHWIIPAFNSFKKKWPNIMLDFQSNNIFNPQSALQKGDIDIVLTSDILPKSNLFYLPIFDFEIRLIFSNNHVLQKNKNILKAKDLKHEIFMIYPIQLHRLDIWKKFLKPSGIIPIFKNVNNTLLLIQMVSANMGISALPHWVIRYFEEKGVISTKKIGNGLWNRLYAAIRYDEHEQPIIKELIKFIKLHSYNYTIDKKKNSFNTFNYL
ncbi:LysR substrate-binding domain-containing protein [Buchnera aphidicola (Mollitrichosiphum nigrofasciatum)]|uniref:LysR substrate-binding domain-containing protein n=1 Tax=Buchnera aphidicola TaxID=9 RepID=UPI0031B86368